MEEKGGIGGAGSGESPGTGSTSFSGLFCTWGEGWAKGLQGGEEVSWGWRYSVLGPGTQQPVAGVAYHLEGDTGAKFNVL